ncbi:glutamyl-tRNA reductase [Motiliproteus sp. MSK22-1]|uniref:glutamyl-tRNA reductase n=1 Tax=Motiliproteus sp. MSK22-1 TaxID=1897630 RepID=UPI000977A678|nr:glutamyl-tRNA reductase [Motiliproteus sp. MSK22-1]OMH39033.1 glutamyl-tRNA reductase [Motiliproteus sp. MSK22-1]
MALLALGINHKTASVAVREKVAFAPEQVEDALMQACQLSGVHEVAILSTCNRTELYCSSASNGGETLLQWMSEYHQLPLEDLQSCSYQHLDADAARHMMRVACGLDSLVLGEPQILGQLKSSYAVAQSAKSIRSDLGRLFQQAFSVAKQVRTQTAIGENPVSVAYAAVSLAQHIFADVSQSSALLIGAGETIDLVARHLVQNGVKKITVANRTLERAQALASQFGAEAVLLSDIPEVLASADIVISSTASQLPILGKGAVERALKQRKHRPMFMVDIAVPRDIEAEVEELSDVYLYTVDDLREVIEENVKSRQDAAEEAEYLINHGTSEFMQQMRSLDAVGTLRTLRQKAEKTRDQELEKAFKMLNKGKSVEDVLQQLARGLTNKLIHSPSVQMKKASAMGRGDLLQLTQELFELAPNDTEDDS